MRVSVKTFRTGPAKVSPPLIYLSNHETLEKDPYIILKFNYRVPLENFPKSD
jgi:hypothetical protein